MAGLAEAFGAGTSFAGVSMAVNATLPSTEFFVSGRVTADAVESRVTVKGLAGADTFDLGSAGGGVTGVGIGGVVTGVTDGIRASAGLRGCLRAVGSFGLAGAGAFALPAANGIWMGALPGAGVTTGFGIATDKGDKLPIVDVAGVGRVSEATLAVVDDPPNIERIIASAIWAGVAEGPWKFPGVLKLDGGGAVCGFNIKLMMLANTGVAGVALATGNAKEAIRPA